jgi:hypothetical protein
MIERVRGSRSSLAALVALLVFAGLPSASPALAADEHPYLPAESHLGEFTEVCGAATDSFGDLYVANLETGVSVYDPSGTLLAELVPFDLGLAMSSCSLAVDDEGAVYVTGFGIPSEQKVAKFMPKGGEFPPTSSTEYELDESAGDEGVIVSHGASGVAVDPETADLYVSEEGTNEVQRLAVPPVAQCSPGAKLIFVWTPTGEVGSMEVSCGASEGPVRSALEDLLGPGTVEVLSGENVPNTYRIRFVGKLGNTDFPAGVLEAREAGSGTVLSTSIAQPNVNGSPSRISVYEADGTLVPGAIGTGVGAAAYYGIDVDPGSGRVYAVDVQNLLVDIFDPSVSRDTPVATIDGSDNPDFSGGFGDLTQAFLAVDRKTGNFFVDNVGFSAFEHPNEGNGVIAQFTPAGEFVSQIGPVFGEEELEFESEIYGPIGLAVDDGLCSPNRGDVYIAANWENVYAFGPTSAFTPAAPAVTAVDPAAGPAAGGDTVTVTGTELGCADMPGAAVEFGGTAAAEVDVNAIGTALTATAPAHAAGTVDVTVRTPNGSSTPTAAGQYTYVDAPTLTGCTPTAGPLSGAPQVTCTGTNLAGASFEFGSGNPASDVIVDGEGTEATMTPPPAAAPGAVPITATTPGGTTAQPVQYTYVAPLSLTVVEVGSGSGTVTCDGGPCEATYPYGSRVTLEATAAAGSTFAGWSGACSGAGECVVAIDADTAVTAAFDAGPQEKEGGGGGAPPPAATGDGSAEVAPSATVRAGIAVLRVSCPGPVACTGKIKLTAKVKTGGKTRTIVVGSASYDVAAGRSATVEVVLTRRAKRLLGKGSHRVRVSGPGIDGTLWLKQSPASGKKR